MFYDIDDRLPKRLEIPLPKSESGKRFLHEGEDESGYGPRVGNEDTEGGMETLTNVVSQRPITPWVKCRPPAGGLNFSATSSCADPLAKTSRETGTEKETTKETKADLLR